MKDPRDQSCWLHRPPLHLKVDHSYYVGSLARLPDEFYSSLWLGNLSEPDGTIDEYAQLVWVKVHSMEDGFQDVRSAADAERVFAALDVAKILARAVYEEEANLKFAAACLHMAEQLLARLRALRP